VYSGPGGDLASDRLKAPSLATGGETTPETPQDLRAWGVDEVCG
jgi:hypothetical protein